MGDDAFRYSECRTCGAEIYRYEGDYCLRHKPQHMVEAEQAARDAAKHKRDELKAARLTALRKLTQMEVIALKRLGF